MKSKIVIQIKVIVLYFIALISVISCSRIEVDKEIERMAKTNSIESEIVGYAGRSEQYKIYKNISNSAIDDEILFYFTNHDSAAVRYYMSLEIVNRDLLPACEVYDYHLQNDDSVVTFNGCLRGRGRVSSSFYYWYRGKIYSEIYEHYNIHDIKLNNSNELLCIDRKIMNELLDGLELHFAINENREKFSSVEDLEKIYHLAYDEYKLPAIEYVLNNFENISNQKKLELINIAISKNKDYEYVINELKNFKGIIRTKMIENNETIVE